MEIDCKTISEWRSWLKENHEKERKVNLIIHKKHTGEKSMSHNEQIREAICFGWIDTTVRRLDENTYQRTFVKRTEKGMWSQNTLRYAKEEMEKGRMSEFGKKMYELGLKKKPHDWDVPKNLEAPEELRKELEKRKLWVKFQELSKSKKRIFLRWLLSAKRDGTRDKRVKEILKMVRTNGTLGVKDV